MTLWRWSQHLHNRSSYGLFPEVVSVFPELVQGQCWTSNRLTGTWGAKAGFPGPVPLTSSHVLARIAWETMNQDASCKETKPVEPVWYFGTSSAGKCWVQVYSFMKTVFPESGGLSICPANKFEVLNCPPASPDLNADDLWDVFDKPWRPHLTF